MSVAVLPSSSSKSDSSSKKYSVKEYAFFFVAGILVLVGVFSAFFRFFSSFSSASKEKELKNADEPTEEEKQMMMIQQREAEKQGFRDNADYYKSHLNTLMKEIESNQVQAKTNFTQFQKFFGTKKASFDDDLTSMEDEQNINTVFMTKDDIDKKKAAMINHGKELGGQYSQLKQEFHQTQQYLMNLNSQWEELYPDEYPLYTPPQPPQPQQQQQRQAQPQQPQQSSFTGDAILSNDQGREILPYS